MNTLKRKKKMSKERIIHLTNIVVDEVYSVNNLLNAMIHLLKNSMDDLNEERTILEELPDIYNLENHYYKILSHVSAIPSHFQLYQMKAQEFKDRIIPLLLEILEEKNEQTNKE